MVRICPHQSTSCRPRTWGFFPGKNLLVNGPESRWKHPLVKKPCAAIAPLCLHASPVDPVWREGTNNSCTPRLTADRQKLSPFSEGADGKMGQLKPPPPLNVVPKIPELPELAMVAVVNNDVAIAAPDGEIDAKAANGDPDAEAKKLEKPEKPVKDPKDLHAGDTDDQARSTVANQHFQEHCGNANADLAQEIYDVSMFYYDTGYAQQIARSELFSNITLAVIAANTVYIGVESDNNDAGEDETPHLSFQVSDQLFCAFFTFEWLVRYLSFRFKRDCIKDMWFKFDSALVLLMVLETWILPVFLGSGGLGIPTGMVKMLRLLRLARMARLMRAFPELVAMIKGVRVASRAVLSALLMNVMLIYIFGVIMNIMLKESDNPLVLDKFGRLLPTMMTLLLYGTFMDSIGYIFRDFREDGQNLAQVVMLLFVLASALTVMNMLIGVLCEVVTQVAETEKEDNAVKLVKDNLLVIMREMDEDGSGDISKEEIQELLNNEAALEVLENLGVDLGYLMEQMDMFYSETEDIAAHRIIDMILMLRANRPPSIKDVVAAQKFTRWKITSTVAALEDRMNKAGIPTHAHNMELNGHPPKIHEVVPLAENWHDPQKGQDDGEHDHQQHIHETHAFG